MALNKVTAFQSQARTESTGTVPIVRSTPTLNTEIVKIGNISQSENNVTVRKSTISDKFFAAKLLNYVESVDILGSLKTVFYTELSTNFRIGDRVFILNGYYDSADYIAKDKYTQFTDGYRVLGVDGCRIILDLEYTGVNPFVDFNLKDLIFVHNITTQAQFDLINSQKIALSQPDSAENTYSLFEGAASGQVSSLYGRNIVYLSSQFLGSTDPLNLSDQITSPGFYVKQGNNWIQADNGFNGGILYDSNLDTNPYNDFDASRILILGEDFSIQILGKTVTFRERQVYKFDRSTADPTIPKKGDWIFDKEYKQPVISRLNFRYGKFKGIHNDGVYGSYDKVAKWDNSTWNSGFFVNGNWTSGAMNNKSITEKSFSAKLSTKTLVPKPAQNVDLTNNRGFGYNYVIDSTILTSTITKGNFENSNLGLTVSTNSVEAFYNNSDIYSVKIDSANLNFCNIYNSYISNASISESIVENTTITNGKLLNNQLLRTVVDQSQYSSNGGIQVIGSDLWSYTYGDEFDYDKIVGTIKLYISDKDFLKLDKGDSFYIEKVNKDVFLTSLNTDEKIHLPIETRYLMGFYDDYELFERPGIKTKVMVSLKPRTNNYRKYYVGTELQTTFVDFYEPNTNVSQSTDSVFWSKITNYSEPWLSEREYSSDDYIKYNGGLYNYNGLTDSNNEPTPTPPLDDWGWDYLGPTPSTWNEFTVFNSGSYVFATVSTGTYALYLCNLSTADPVQIGSVNSDSYIKTTAGTNLKKKKQITDYNGASYSSIDIESEAFGWYVDANGLKSYTNKVISNKSGISKVPIDLIRNVFVKNYIKLSDFRSGVFVNSTWQSGCNIGYYSNIISKSNNRLLIQRQGTGALTVTINNRPFKSGGIISGFDIRSGDSVWLSGVSYTGTSGEVSISGRYTVLSEPVRNINSSQISISITPTFTQSFAPTGTFSVFGAEGNTYASLSNFSIQESILIYGLFKRTNINNSFITNDQFDNKDTTFNPKNTSLLRLINIIFKDNNISVSDGVMYRSHFVNGDFRLGIVHNSFWNGLTFSNGIFSAGSWRSGRFISGKLIDSNATSPSTDYHHNEIFYKNWLSGTFETGEFVNSVWIDGTFNNGRFYNSHFYGGTWNNGILGSKNLRMISTSFGHYKKIDGIGTTVSTWNNGVVENAILGGNGVVYWYDGKCNSGEFTSFGTTSENESIWYNGEFNGSKFTNLARWKNGVFNSGKFWSYYGWENVSPLNYSQNIADYGWEDGKFISGEFGYGGLTSNSTWYGGQFSGGEFRGRFWRDGYFISGNFFGSGPTQSIDSFSSSAQEFNYADSFTSSYYGLWAGGFVVDNVKSIVSTQNIEINRTRAINSKYSSKNKTTLNNILWLNGTFNHDNAVINNSLWLSGTFLKGEFNGGVLNPYVDRSFSGSFSNSSFGTSSYWVNGIFVTGSIWSTDWLFGRFRNGYMSGVRWFDGVFEYGKADNIYWIDGTWRNGNWNGSPFKYNLLTFTVSDGFDGYLDVNYLNKGREKDVILKVASYTSPLGATQSYLHLMNIFSASSTVYNLNITNDLAQSLGTNSLIASWTYSYETYLGSVIDETVDSVDFVTKPETLDRSTWIWQSGFDLVRGTLTASFATPKNPLTESESLISNAIGGGEGGIRSSTSLSNLLGGGQGPSVTTPNYSNYNIIETVKPNPQRIVTSFDGNITTYGGSNSYYKNQSWGGYNIHTAGDTPPSSKLYAKLTGGNNTNIFTDQPSTYTVEILVAVELVPSVEVEVFVGGLSSSIFTLDTDYYRWTEFSGSTRREFYSYHARVYKLSLLYNTSTELFSRTDGQKLSIRKNSNGKLIILNAYITKRDIQYHPTLHNNLYNAIDLIGGTVSFPATSSIALTTVSSTGFEIGINFGNGIFRSGIWENGVWNNGYRSASWFNSSDIVKAVDVLRSKTYKVKGLNRWYVTIQCYDELIDGDGNLLINPNKKILVGNIININVNGKRSFMRDPLKIVNLDVLNKEITFEFISNFEIRDIKKDSDNHLIYVTQNIWQNGVFLNGYFNGVWGNGVFKGYPKTTEMVDSHWITGYLEGGHFKSSKIGENKNERLPAYNTGLIQSVTFKDKNIASPPLSSFESWMDIDYYTYSNVNLNTYSRNIGVSGKTNRVIETYDVNLYGAPSSDVLSSDSYLRNLKTSAQRRYSLGTKFDISNNLLGRLGDFTVPHSDTVNFTYSKNTELDRINKAVARSEFFDQGWTYSYTSFREYFATYFTPFFTGDPIVNYSGGVGYSVTSNTSPANNGKLSFKLQKYLGLLNTETGVREIGVPNSDVVIFNLSNTLIQTKPDRYYEIDIKMDSLPVTQSLFLLGDTSQVGSASVFFHDPQLNTSKNYKEYFYNLNGLDLIMWYIGAPTATFSIDKISVNEVDSIPFFKYYKTNSEIDFSIKNPYLGSAPVIDYTNKNFDFLGNVELGIDYRVIVKQNASVTRVGYASRFTSYQFRSGQDEPEV